MMSGRPKRYVAVAVIFALVAVLGAGACGSSSSDSAQPKKTSEDLSWRDPTVATKISADGESVVDQRIITVSAKSPWVDTGLSLGAGQRLWVDTATNGRWSGNPHYFPYSDANGLSVYPGQYRVDAKAPVLSLIGFIGSSPPTPSEVSVPHPSPGGGPGGVVDPRFVSVGDTLLRIRSGRTGKVWLRNNDNTNSISDVGQQIAQVTITAKHG